MARHVHGNARPKAAHTRHHGHKNKKKADPCEARLFTPGTVVAFQHALEDRTARYSGVLLNSWAP